MNQYPLWRYLLIIGLIVLGVLYALPNMYGDDPAIEIASKDHSDIPTALMDKVKTALADRHLRVLGVDEESKSRLLIRFPDPETQLNAQNIIEATVGSNYTAALNLAPRTPAWLRAIGAKPMKLGLDLLGGVHFLLNVDAKEMLKERAQADMHAMSTTLRQARIRYTGINLIPPHGIKITFREAADLEKAKTLLASKNHDYQYQVNPNHPLQLDIQFTQQAQLQLIQEAVSQNIMIMRTRVNELNVSEPVIRQQGKTQISVDLPGIQDMARAKNMLGKVATIRVQLVDTTDDAAQAARTGIVPFGTTLYRDEHGVPHLVKNQIVLHGRSILRATAILDQDNQPAVNIRIGGNEVSKFSRVTAENVGKPLATVYIEKQTTKKIVNGKVETVVTPIEKLINVARIKEPLGDTFVITGLKNMQTAKDLALLLRSGAYVAPVSYAQERSVGPSLGRQNIRMGVMSTELASLAVIIFMAFYYRLFGLVADVALILNVVFVLAVMSVMGFTMTLPGIAGIVLTVGMAVDANVLINERIREELRNGVSPQASIHAGYERAFSTIVDANVTTLIVAVVLFALGTGPVQNFALTLSIGLLTSMVTAIFFTRAIINLIYGRRHHLKHLSIGIRVDRTKAVR